MSWTVKEIKSWRDFLDMVEDIRAPEYSHIFRGQPDSDWLLKPSILRPFKEPYKNSSMLELEEVINRDFIGEAYSLINPILYKETKNILDWWPIMQHHGVPTRLLDWSKSPYVAAYFAVNQQLASDGTIWVLCVKTLNSIMENTDNDSIMENTDNDLSDPETIKSFTQPDALERLYEYTPMLKTDRSIAQQSIFTVCKNISSEHSSIIEDKFISNNNNSYFRIRIGKELKAEFRLRLPEMNIRSSTLFPGIDGIGRTITELTDLFRTI